MLTSENFRKQLRRALNHLYDPDYLRHSPLSSVFDVGGKFDTPMLLQRVLTDAIESMKPGPDVPESSQTWRTYDILLSRYIQQLSQEQVASQIGVSSRQLAREQAVAVEMLALYLWEEYHLNEAVATSSSTLATIIKPVISTKENEVSGVSGESIADELSWVETAEKYPRANVKEAIHTVIDLVTPLANRYAVDIQVQFDNALPDLSVHPVALRQVLLSLINIAIHPAGNGSVQVYAHQQEGEVEIEISVYQAQPATIDADPASFEMAEKLLSLSKGQLLSGWNGTTIYMKVRLLIFEPAVVLMVDDNQDILNLFQRYTQGTRFHLIGTHDARRVVSLAEKHHPHIIILDLMMPEMDGWQILGLLRRHPSTAQIPIIVCSIVSQEELAYTLGAKGFLRKPVTREKLLEALEHLLKEGIVPR